MASSHPTFEPLNQKDLINGFIRNEDETNKNNNQHVENKIYKYHNQNHHHILKEKDLLNGGKTVKFSVNCDIDNVQRM